MLMSCIEHQVHNHSSSFAGPSPFCCWPNAMLNTPTRMRGATNNAIHPAKLPANTSPSTWTRCAANWAVIELEQLIGNLVKPLFGIGHRPAHTHPHATRAPLLLVSFVCLPGCVFPLFILLSFIYM